MSDRLYIGRYSKTKGISICTYKKGNIEEIGTLPFIEDSSYLHINGNILYSVIETEKYHGKNGGAIAAYLLEDENKIISIQNTFGKHPCHLITDSKRTMLFAANYTEGTVSIFPLKADDSNAGDSNFDGSNTVGSIGEMSWELKHEGCSVNPDRQEKPHMHYLQFMEDEAYICVTDLGTDRLSGYKLWRDEGMIKLIHAFDIHLPSGSGPRHFVCSSEGMYIYILNELSNCICVYKKSGDLDFTHIQTITTLPEGSFSSSAAAIRITKDGRFIYASNRGHNSISVYKINTENGQLNMIQNIGCNGVFPRDIVLDEKEEYLLCANQGSDSVTSLLRNKESGYLTLTDKIFCTEKPVCVIFK